MLMEEGLLINKNKTINYHIYRTGDESWKLCKYLVSFINTEEDIKHRAELALDTYRVIKQFLIASI